MARSPEELATEIVRERRRLEHPPKSRRHYWTCPRCRSHEFGMGTVGEQKTIHCHGVSTKNRLEDCGYYVAQDQWEARLLRKGGNGKMIRDRRKVKKYADKAVKLTFD